MSESGFWTTYLRKRTKTLSLPDCGFELYLFGSARVSATPSDLDLLVVYNPCLLTRASMARLASMVASEIEIETSVRVDLCRLTISEAEQSKFRQLEGCVLVYPTRRNCP